MSNLFQVEDITRPTGYSSPPVRAFARERRLAVASVLDIAPTLLHMFGAPIPLDMDGKLLPQIFEASWLEAHPPRYADIDTSLSSDEEAITEGREEILEQLKALGYIQ